MTKKPYWEPRIGPGTLVSVSGVAGMWLVASATTTAGKNVPEYTLVPDGEVAGVRLICGEDKLTAS